MWIIRHKEQHRWFQVYRVLIHQNWILLWNHYNDNEWWNNKLNFIKQCKFYKMVKQDAHQIKQHKNVSVMIGKSK